MVLWLSALPPYTSCKPRSNSGNNNQVLFMLLHSAMLHLRLSSHDTFQKTGVLDCLKYTNKRGLSGLDFLRVLSCPTPMILWQVAFL
jgi:hypothetical protein